MKKLSIKIPPTLLALLCFGNTMWAQSVPNWYNEQGRVSNYPDNIYYTGIAYSEITASSPESTSVEKAEDAARAEALSKILVSVKSSTVSSSVSTTMTTTNGLDEQFVEQFSSLTNIDVAFKDVPGLQCQHYIKGSTIIAFAYVKKSDLALYYDRKITTSLTKIETALDNADQLAARGEKIRAREMAKSGVGHAADVENAQRILLALDRNADVQTEKSSALSKRLVQTLSELKNATAIYLDCKAYAQNKPYTFFANDLKGHLSKIGCKFVSKREQADWVISVEADVVQENKAQGGYFVWVDGAVAVRNNKISQVIYNERISTIAKEAKKIDDNIATRGAKANLTMAYADAYKKTAKIVAEKISEIIKK